MKEWLDGERVGRGAHNAGLTPRWRAGSTPPPNPAHGPWRRFQAQAFEGDVRTMGRALGDGWTVFLPLVIGNR
jgi:hypothetical protein